MEQNEELIKTWIGTKNQDLYYKKIHTGGFNIVAFFIPDILFITRKMYIEAIILVVLQMLFSTVLNILKVPAIVFSLVSLVLRIISGFTYYYLYGWSIERRIKKYQRKNLSYEQQLEIARNNSGDKFTLGVVGMLILTVIMATVLTFGMYFILKIVNEENTSTDYPDDYLYDDQDLNDYNEYDEMEDEENNNYNLNNNEDKLIGIWHDNNNKVTLVLYSDNSVEYYTDDMTTIYIKGTYTLEQQEEQYGDEYLLTISTNDRTLQGTHLTDSYTTQFSLITEDYTEMVMLNVITYTMYNFEKVG